MQTEHRGHRSSDFCYDVLLRISCQFRLQQNKFADSPLCSRCSISIPKLSINSFRNDIICLTSLQPIRASQHIAQLRNFSAKLYRMKNTGAEIGKTAFLNHSF